jgi:trimethylamine:corrinoid methyltransferase-like protein
MFREYFYPGLAVRMNFDQWEQQNKPTPLTRANESLQIFKEMHNTVLDPELVREIRQRFLEIIDI